MKHYKDKKELLQDIQTLSHTSLSSLYMKDMYHELYLRWFNTSPDSHKHINIKTKETLYEYSTFIKDIGLPSRVEELEITSLFELWRNDAVDSPWNTIRDMETAKTLVSISEGGVSSQWSGEHTVFVDLVPKKSTNVFVSPYNLRSR